jgi:hypothetical protein
VYADFDYPEEIAGFIRYMPMRGPDLGSKQLNEKRMLETWGRYIEEGTRRWIRAS